MRFKPFFKADNSLKVIAQSIKNYFSDISAVACKNAQQNCERFKVN